MSVSSSNLDMSLDDLVDKSVARRRSHPRLAHGAQGLLTPRALSDAAGVKRGGCSPSSGRSPSGTRSSNARAEPYDRGGRPAWQEALHGAPSSVRALSGGGGVQRGGGHGRGRTRASGGQKGETDTPSSEPYGEHMASVASSRNPLLKVSSESKPNSVAGYICNVVRESAGNEPPAVMATGPAAINQAMKAIAIARKYLLDEDAPNQVDLLVLPKFEQDVRDGSNMVFKLERSEAIAREPAETDLCCKSRTDAFKLAGAIAGRVRDGKEVALTVKGAVPVLISVKAIALAQDYVKDEGIELRFAVQFRNLEDPELNNTPSTYLHMAIIPRHTF
eukprot:scaffold47912_cov73-Phaeocystis_antarctica.AAC.10